MNFGRGIAKYCGRMITGADLTIGSADALDSMDESYPFVLKVVAIGSARVLNDIR